MNKKSMSRFIACLMVFIMVFAFSPAVMSQAATKKTSYTYTIYLRSKEAYSDFTQISVPNATKLTNIKSSKKSVAKADGYYVSNSKNNNTYYDNSGKETNKYNSSYICANLNVILSKPGTSVISFKDNKKNSYEYKYVIKDYVNPVKTFQLARSGVTSANYAKYFNNGTESSKSVKIDKNGTVKLSVTAQKGWKITGIHMHNSTWTSKASEYGSRGKEIMGGADKATLSFPGYNTKWDGNVTVTFENKNNGATLSVNLPIKNNSTKK